jgi:hypothetical protein
MTFNIEIKQEIPLAEGSIAPGNIYGQVSWHMYIGTHAHILAVTPQRRVYK